MSASVAFGTSVTGGSSMVVTGGPMCGCGASTGSGLGCTAGSGTSAVAAPLAGGGGLGRHRRTGHQRARRPARGRGRIGPADDALVEKPEVVARAGCLRRVEGAHQIFESVTLIVDDERVPNAVPGHVRR